VAVLFGSHATYSCRTPDQAGPAHRQAGGPEPWSLDAKKTPTAGRCISPQPDTWQVRETARGSRPDAALLRPMMAPAWQHDRTGARPARGRRPGPWRDRSGWSRLQASVPRAEGRPAAGSPGARSGLGSL